MLRPMNRKGVMLLLIAVVGFAVVIGRSGEELSTTAKILLNTVAGYSITTPEQALMRSGMNMAV